MGGGTQHPPLSGGSGFGRGGHGFTPNTGIFGRGGGQSFARGQSFALDGSRGGQQGFSRDGGTFGRGGPGFTRDGGRGGQSFYPDSDTFDPACDEVPPASRGRKPALRKNKHAGQRLAEHRPPSPPPSCLPLGSAQPRNMSVPLSSTPSAGNVPIEPRSRSMPLSSTPSPTQNGEEASQETPQEETAHTNEHLTPGLFSVPPEQRRLITLSMMTTDDEVKEKIKDAVQMFYTEPWPTWGMIYPETQNQMYKAWASRYSFLPHEKFKVRQKFCKRAGAWVRRKFQHIREKRKQPKWMQDDVWHDLLSYWDNDSHFKEVSDRNKKNRDTERAIPYRGGSKPAAKHYNELVQEHKGDPGPRSLFQRLYGHKDGTFPEGRARDIAEQFDNAIEQATQSGTVLTRADEHQQFRQIAGCKKGHHLGYGNLVDHPNFSKHSGNIPSLVLENLELRHRMSQMEKILETQEVRMQERMQTMFAEFMSAQGTHAREMSQPVRIQTTESSHVPEPSLQPIYKVINPNDYELDDNFNFAPRQQ